MRKIILSIICAFFLLITGCAGKTEINELALVMAVGLDKGKKDDTIKITAQVARPGDSRGQTGAPTGQTGDPIWAASAEGESIFDAIRNLAKFSSRRVFWAHNYTIVINEDLAKDVGISDIIDFFTRNPQLRMRTWVMITPDEASEVVSTITGLEVVPGEAINKLFRYTELSAQTPKTQMIDLYSAYLNESTQPFLARVKLKERGVSNKKPGQAGSYKQVELAGAGVFKNDKLVGVLEPEESRGLLPFVEKVETGVLSLKCPVNPDKKISIEIKEQSFSVEPGLKDGMPSFKVSQKTYGSIVEAGCPISLEETDKIRILEKDMEDKLKEELQTVIKLAQKEFKSDFIYFGQVFHNQYPAEWKELKHEWDEVFQNVPVEVSTTVSINDSSLLYHPTKSGN